MTCGNSTHQGEHNWFGGFSYGCRICHGSVSQLSAATQFTDREKSPILSPMRMPESYSVRAPARKVKTKDVVRNKSLIRLVVSFPGSYPASQPNASTSLWLKIFSSRRPQGVLLTDRGVLIARKQVGRVPVNRNASRSA